MNDEKAWDLILQRPLPDEARLYFEGLAAKIGVEIERVGAGDVAEFGCGRGELLGILARKFPSSSFIGYDLSPVIVKSLRKAALPNQEFEPVRLPDVPMKSFDCVLCINTLHYLNRPLEAIRNLWSIVCQGGILIFNYPNRYYLAALPPEPQDEVWGEVEGPMRRGENLLSKKRIVKSIRSAKWRVFHRSRNRIVYLMAERPSGPRMKHRTRSRHV